MSLKEFLKESFVKKSDIKRIKHNIDWLKEKNPDTTLLERLMFTLQSQTSLYRGTIDFKSEEYKKTISDLITELNLEELLK